MFSKMDPSVSGKGSETVYRDKMGRKKESRDEKRNAKRWRRMRNSWNGEEGKLFFVSTILSLQTMQVITEQIL